LSTNENDLKKGKEKKELNSPRVTIFYFLISGPTKESLSQQYSMFNFKMFYLLRGLTNSSAEYLSSTTQIKNIYGLIYERNEG
jgi:hypothetical protein